jgi:hypothetical protein
MVELSTVIEELKALLENGDEVSPEVARRLQLALSLDTHIEVKKINGRLKKVEEAAKNSERYPSILYLLRHKTKTTVAVIVMIFVILSLFYVSGLRTPIMLWLGLPPLIP